MRWTRCVFPKAWRRDITPRRLAAARRFAQKQKDKVALFPEMVAQIETPEVRLKAFGDGEEQLSAEWRDLRAKQWREARRLLAAIPTISRRGLIAYWDRSSMPSDPVYLLVLIRQFLTEGKSGWSKLRELRQLQLVGQRRLPVASILRSPR